MSVHTAGQLLAVVPDPAHRARETPLMSLFTSAWAFASVTPLQRSSRRTSRAR